ncbi:MULTISPECIES: ABC transporter permease [unclassified Paenibacillus]|uniref:ABC transporter permease n=1 Tax=unclassified Paenibacillus TaxID=185978 RepID=UPI00104BDA4D|nr:MULTISPECIES: ABC transporter permease [unclassified Paenibacillus]NIK71350.1 NitT/TauT family transport system permease protein [Paenibacillus sp. BK720]TCM96933.1 NitT/TauT family transport system permease protein [Paenibacillus sp. BK033]
MREETITSPDLSFGTTAGTTTKLRASALKKAWKRIGPPSVAFILFIGGWELFCRLSGLKPYLLPKPSDIVLAASENASNLWVSVYTTITEAVLGFLLSILLGVGFAILLASSKLIERSIYPYAIIMQTIPIVAIAPIIVIWFGAGMNAIIIIAFLIGFFPMLSNTLIGLNSTDHNMKNLFYLYNASSLQTMIRLRIPAALPYIVAGLKISCTLAVIGAIVGEYIAGIGGGNGGLGYAITVASSRLQTAYLFACGLSASLLGIAFFLLVNAFSKWMLSSWHESEMKSSEG